MGKIIKDKRIYDIWHNMIYRCGNPKYPTYMDCSVCAEWLEYKNFKTWYLKNYYSIENEKMCVDKDILYKGNKVYSALTCCIIPERINMLLTSRQFHRGELPIGVYFHNNKYEAKCKIDGKDKYLGSYDNVISAFKAYKKEKENAIKQVANQYKNRIPKHIYHALMNYSIDYND